MRKWVLPLLLILAFLLPSNSHAQDALTLSSLQIQIWPEYDKPDVLVIYQLTLSPTTIFPATVSMRIPISAGEPNAVAVRQADGKLYTMDYASNVAGEWVLVNFTTTSPEIQLEYYDPDLIKTDVSRHFEYVWPGDYAISQLTIQVQQPASATDMRISPSLGAGATGEDNLKYFTQDIGEISSGQTFRITVDYTKSDDTLSAENLPIQPSAPVPESTGLDLNLASWLPWILGIIGAGLIIGGIVWFWQTGRQKPLAKTHRSRSKSINTDREASASSPEIGVYCSQCGKRASSGDVFCRYCGTQIRTK